VAEDPRFATQAGRLSHPDYRTVYREVLLAAAAKLTVADAMGRLEDAGVAAVAVVDLGGIPDHPQIVANATFVEHDDPVAGRLRQPRPAARFGTTGSTAKSTPPGAAPTPGQHTDEVLIELGYTRSEIAALRADGTLG
jgi:crotonobetainyl-CoA:carnitine CoA-transferase CaiB-like acyl-CoA transferase